MSNNPTLWSPIHEIFACINASSRGAVNTRGGGCTCPRRRPLRPAPHMPPPTRKITNATDTPPRLHSPTIIIHSHQEGAFLSPTINVQLYLLPPVKVQVRWPLRPAPHMPPPTRKITNATDTPPRLHSPTIIIHSHQEGAFLSPTINVQLYLLPPVKVQVRWAKGKKLTNHLPNLSLITPPPSPCLWSYDYGHA